MVDHPTIQAEGTARPSFVTRHIEDMAKDGHLSPEDRYNLRDAAYMLYGGALSFLLALANQLTQSPCRRVRNGMLRIRHFAHM